MRIFSRWVPRTAPTFAYAKYGEPSGGVRDVVTLTTPNMLPPVQCKSCFHSYTRTLTYVHHFLRCSSPALHRCQRSTIATNAISTSVRKVIFSGIQPTGVPHLGNYLGALREWVQLQDNAAPGTRLIFSIVDLHALTVPQDPIILRNWRKQTLAILLAVGLDPKCSIIFFQSAVRALGNMLYLFNRTII